MPNRRSRQPHFSDRTAGQPPAVRRIQVQLRESAAERVDIRESPRTDTQKPDAQSGNMLIQLITAGWGTSGYYGPDLLNEAAKKRAFPSGLPMYLDHPSMSEESDRPERSVRDLAAVLTEDAYYDSGRQALVAQAKVFSPYRSLISDLHEHIGLSIRAGGVGEYGQIGDRKGVIVKEITETASVDFVTKAGRGGKVLALMESARATAQATALREARNVGAWLESRLHLTLTSFADDMYGDGRLTREERITLSAAIGDALATWTSRVQGEAPQLFERDLYATPEAVAAQESTRLRETTADQIRVALDRAIRDAYAAGKDQWAWVRDYDPDTSLVWFEASDGDTSGTWQQPYETTGADATVTAALTGDRTAVVVQTTYVPAATDATAGLVEADQPQTAAPLIEAATTDVTGGTAPTAPTQESEEVPVSGTNTGPAPGTGAAETAPTTPDVVNVQAREADQARVAAETARDVALREAEDSKRELARFRAIEAARPVATAKLAESDLPAAAQARVLASVVARVPLTEAHVLDQAALVALVEAEATAEKTYLASLAEGAGEGRVRGVGGPPATPATGHASDNKFAPAAAPQVNTSLVEAYKARGLSESAALKAAVGRPY